MRVIVIFAHPNLRDGIAVSLGKRDASKDDIRYYTNSEPGFEILRGYNREELTIIVHKSWMHSFRSYGQYLQTIIELEQQFGNILFMGDIRDTH